VAGTETPRIRIVRSVRVLWGVRAFDVVLDGNVVGRIRNGRHSVFDVATGRHEVQLRVGSARSQSLLVESYAGQTVHLRCDGGDLRGWLSRAFKDEPPITLVADPGPAPQ
jgi:hypothetical protein